MSFELAPVQAKEAALLAPGPLVSLEEDGLEVLALSALPERRVVRIVYLSGLGERSVAVFRCVDEL